MTRTDILNQDNREELIKSYRSNFDFKDYEIEDNELIERISEKEEAITTAGRQIAKKTLELGKLFYETHELLSNYKTGTFVAWIKYMNIDKNFVYRAIDRWKIFLKHQNPMLAEASVKTIEFIKKNDEILDKKKINEILEDPKLAAKTIKEMQDEKIETKKETSIEAKILEIDKKIEKLEDKIRKLENEKKKLFSNTPQG